MKRHDLFNPFKISHQIEPVFILTLKQSQCLNNEYGLKNEGQDCKTGLVRGWVLVGGKRVNGGNKGG
jgi:hypothetical protein